VKFVADENIPRSMVRQLRDAGHDVAYIADGWPGLLDKDVLALARDEQRVLITFDRDFGELIFRRRLAPPPSVIYLRRRGFRTRIVVAAAIALLASGQPGEFVGRFVVVTGEDVRHRPLPTPQ
jgi:predicted nuclease of predicted toxin-antitoxin system